MKKLIYVIITVLCVSSFADQQLRQAIDKFQGAEAVKAEIKKTRVMVLLDETKVSDGEMIFSKGKMRLQLMSKDEPTLIVINKEAIFIETNNATGDGKHVSRITSKELKNRSKAPITLMFEDKKFLELFNITSHPEKKHIYSLKPKKPKDFQEFTELRIKLNKDGNILTFGYIDDLENTVTYTFEKLDFKYKAKEKDFVFKAIPGTEIQDL